MEINSYILILDNTTTITNPWKKIIAKNYKTDEAVGGIEALRKIQNNPIDLIIVNISLKNMNGVEAIGKIRSHYPKLPIITIFEKKDVLDLKQAKAYGINSLVQQPVDVRKLLLEIGRLLSNKKNTTADTQKKLKTDTSSIVFKKKHPEQHSSKSTVNHNSEDLEKSFYDGLSAISSNNIDEAITIFQSMLSVTRIKRETWRRYLEDALFQLGQCYATKGQFEKSISYYTEFIKKAPHNTSHKSALLYLGKNYLSLKKYKKAAYFFQKVAAAKPYDSFSTQARKLLKSIKG